MPRTTDGPYLGEYLIHLGTRAAGYLSDDELDHVEENVMRHYNDGFPFFSRNSLIQIATQLEDARNGKTDKVTYNGIDGVPVEIPVKIGDKCEGYGNVKATKDQEFFIKAAFVHYMSYDKLCRSWSKRDASFAYCSMHIQHVIGVRSTVDGKEHIIPGEPREKIEECYNTAREIWQTSPECAKLKSLLLQTTVSKRASKVIGFALGSLARHDLEGEFRHRTGVQHAMLMTLRDMLGMSGAQSGVSCYVQDPFYTNADIGVLTGAGFTVLGDPMGFLEIDDTAVVVSIAPDCPVKEVLVDLDKPAIIIWMAGFEPGVGEDGIPRLCTDPEGPRVKKFLAEFYDKVDFVGQEKYMGTLDVYIRRMGNGGE